MDPAQEYENLMLSRQKPMNDAIDRGDSAVQQFYSGAAVFVTGGSGFLGKQLIEKLFRSCALKKMYILLRSKKGKSMQERLQYMLKDKVFDVVRAKQPHFADKIVPVEGDVADIRLGLSDKDWTAITKEVDMVLHLAATISFHEPLRVATLVNVRGTREALALGRECKKLRNFVHVSTAYAHATSERIGKEVLEDFYPAPVPPDVLIGLVETVDEERLSKITPDFIKGWPNTYTFTKAVAEELVRTTAGDLPVCVVKPPIVMNSYLEPLPGWLDMSSVMGPIGVFLGVGLGVLHVFFVDVKNKLAMVPVDYVNNAIIAAGWDSSERRLNGDAGIPVYTVTDKEHFIHWGTGRSVVSTEGHKLPTTKAVWYCFLLETNNRLIYWLLMWLVHYIPAYILDGVCAIVPMKPKNIPSFVKIYNKIEKFSDIYKHFTTNQWQFRSDNLKAMINKMSDADKLIFNCDMNTINLVDLIKVLIIGLRKYIIKDGLKGTASAIKKQNMLCIANYITLVLYIYILWSIAAVFWMFMKYIIF